MCQFVGGVAGDVLRAVAVKIGQRRLKRVTCAVAAEFVVLQPQIGFDQFGCGQKLQDGDIAAAERGLLELACAKVPKPLPNIPPPTVATAPATRFS